MLIYLWHTYLLFIITKTTPSVASFFAMTFLSFECRVLSVTENPKPDTQNSSCGHLINRNERYYRKLIFF